MKKIFFAAAVIAAFALTSCGGNKTEEQPVDSTAVETTVDSTVAPAEEAATVDSTAANAETEEAAPAEKPAKEEAK
ncbi:MAG: hypothetical protein Q4A76_01280 [Porphyromonadaceae bacterium]|nr:hypothetical protein [Porphyromonadaceae bacterium]